MYVDVCPLLRVSIWPYFPHSIQGEKLRRCTLCHLTLLFSTQLVLLCVCSYTKHKTPNKSHSWLAPLGSLCSARVRVRPLTHRLALRARDTGRRGGGGRGARFARHASLGSLCLARFARLASLGSRRVQAADASARPARSRPRAKMGGVQWSSLR